MKNSTARPLFLVTMLALVTIVSISDWPPTPAANASPYTGSERSALAEVAAAPARSPHERIQRAWQQAQESGSYRFATQIVQTTYPAPSLANVGRSSRQETVHVEGHADLPAQTLQLALWAGGGSLSNPRDGVEVRVTGDQAYGRPIGGEWEEIDDFSAAFAPAKDLMAYLAGAKNVQALGAETRGGIGFTRYSFDLDGPQFAEYLRDQLVQYMRQEGELPAGINLSVSDQFRQITGGGEIWIDNGNLPLRLSVELAYPQQANGERVEASIQTDFSGFAPLAEHSPLEHVVSALKFPTTADDWAQTGRQMVIVSSLLAFVLLIVIGSRSKKVYAAVSLAMILSMVLTPLLQSHQVSAYMEKQQVRLQEWEEDQEAQAAAQKAREDMQSSGWDPTTDPLAGESAGPADAAEIPTMPESRSLGTRRSTSGTWSTSLGKYRCA